MAYVPSNMAPSSQLLFPSDAIVFAQKHEIILLSIDSNIEEVASIVDIMVQQNVGIESNELKIFRNTGFLRELGFDY